MKRRKSRGFAAFKTLLELRAPPLVDELQLYLAKEDPAWRDPDALAATFGVGTPYWSVAWAGGIALARYVLDNPFLFARKRVIDFGSGSGLVALAAARVGATVTAIDIDPVAADAIAANARANGLHVDVDTDDWSTRKHRVADIVLAGDVCYDKASSIVLMRWLRLQAAYGADVLLGDSRRPHGPKGRVSVVFEVSHVTTRQTDDDALARARVIRISGAR